MPEVDNGCSSMNTMFSAKPHDGSEMSGPDSGRVSGLRNARFADQWMESSLSRTILLPDPRFPPG